MSKLSNIELQEYWIFLYLKYSNKTLVEACIDRAYLDVCRTMHGISKKNKKAEKLKELKQLMKMICDEITLNKFKSQNQFDEWHKKKCYLLKTQFKKKLEFDLNIGQAQKWINMTLKYMFVLGDSRIKNISMNYKHFHIPIDNIILDNLSRKGINKFDLSWSMVDNYETYLNYQKSVRSSFSTKIPMDVEFKSYMEN